MAITSTIFLFVFLPVALGIFYIADDRAKEYILVALSLFFYAVGSLKYFELFVVAVCITVVLGRMIARAKEKKLKKVLVTVGVLVNLSILIYYKYMDFAISTINDLAGSTLALRNLALPLGISFFTFKAISYLCDVYSEKVKLDHEPVRDVLYLSFFGQVLSGPLARFGDFKNTFIGTEEKNHLFSDGVFRFLIGFNKKVLLANVLANITNEVYSTDFSLFTPAFAWLGAICYSLQLFFDFAGYSDMAIGLSEMFGYHCMENFNYPYMTESVAKFWRRWHISLSQWFRDYIYIPLGGSRTKSKGRVYINMLAVWLATGIWHGAAWNFVVWGLGFFILIAFEKVTGFPDTFKSKGMKIAYRIFTLFFINFEWVIFRAKDLKTAVIYIQNMFMFQKHTISDLRTMFIIKDYFWIILFAIILSFPVVPNLRKRFEGKEELCRIYDAVIGILVIVLFIWAITFAVVGQNNPFAYANF